MKSDYIDDTDDHITDDAVAHSAAKRIPAGSVLCVMRSGILKHSFPVAVSRREVTINQDLRAVYPRPDVDPAFLAHFLRRSSQDVLHECSKDGTTVDSIEAGRLMQHPVPLPDVAIQRSIVSRIEELLGGVDDGLQLLSTCGEGLSTYRRALRRAAVSGEMTREWRSQRPSGGAEPMAELLALHSRSKSSKLPQQELESPTWMEELPKTWTTFTALGVIQWASGKFLPDRSMVPGPVPVYGGNGIAGHHNEHLVDGSTLIVGRVGFYCGNTHVSEGRAWITDNAIYARELPPFIDPAFLKLAYDQLDLRALAQGGAQPFVNQALLNAVRLPLPPLEEQRAIVTAYSAATSTCDGAELDRVARSAGSLRQSILAAAFRGDLIA